MPALSSPAIFTQEENDEIIEGRGDSSVSDFEDFDEERAKRKITEIERDLSHFNNQVLDLGPFTAQKSNPGDL